MIARKLDNAIFANSIPKLGFEAFFQGFIFLVNFHFSKFINDLQKPIYLIIIIKNFPMLDIIRQGRSVLHLDFIN